MDETARLTVRGFLFWGGGGRGGEGGGIGSEEVDRERYLEMWSAGFQPDVASH